MSGDALGGAPGQRGALTCSPKLIPKNMLLPAGLRQRDQTKKSPTGPLDREALLQYLEQQALEVKERDDLVPFTGEKKGMGSLTSMPPRTQWWSLTCPHVYKVGTFVACENQVIQSWGGEVTNIISI